MRTGFLRILVLSAVVQFLITRSLAGRAVEEGRAERMWMMYPANVLLNAAAWTVAISLSSRALRIVRPRQ
jgi:hypothetical protein